jgi:hypothetical protein
MGNKRKIYLLSWGLLIAFAWPHGFQDVHRLFHQAYTCGDACETGQTDSKDCPLCHFGFYQIELPAQQTKRTGTFFVLPKVLKVTIEIVELFERPTYRLRGPPAYPY